MSPEQALGKTVDQKSDLFSLGSVMYVMCSGRPPFRAPSTIAVLKRVVDEQPRDIRELVPDVPRWLIGIIVRLHAKNPEHRPSGAQEVEELLTLGESGVIALESNLRRRVSKVLSWRVALAVLLLLLPVVLFASNNRFFMFSKSKPLLEDLPVERSMLNKNASAQDVVPKKQQVFLGHENPTIGVLFSSDEKTIVSASNGDHHEVHGGVRHHVTGTDNSIRLWEIESGKEIRRLRMTHGHGYGPISMCISPTSETIAIASGWIFANGPSEPSVYIWKTNRNVLHQHFTLPTNHAIRTIDITPDGSQVRTTTSGKGLIHSWALATGESLPVVELKNLPFRVEAPRMSWSEDGRYVLSAQWGGAGDTLAWDAVTGEIVKRFQGHAKPPSHVVMAPGGQKLVTCGDDFTIRIWDWDSAAELVCIGDDEILESGVRCVACSPDGNQLMAGSADGMLILYSLTSGEELARFSGHTGAINDVTFSASGRYVASASDDSSVRVWEMPDAK
jgi:WD40 repeat protein